MKLVSLMDSQMASLVDIHSDIALERLGLKEKLRLIREGNKVQTVSLVAMLSGFYSSLFTLGGE